ncbi:RING finger domain-containing protein [Endozoicomonas lisbonensis]|uniref:RING-type domain-containing protein n=1 Tax=Endozoicomonas lisbonensis TaxID=3120522 RepID=A0ABV2SHT5_9GAMM
MEATGLPPHQFDMGEPMDIDDQATGVSDSGHHSVFNGHKVCLNPNAKKVTERVNDNCAICWEPMTEGMTFTAPLTVLPCYHAFHKDCIETALKERSVCSICQASVHEVRTFSTPDELNKSLSLECSKDGCDVKNGAEANHFHCPYPLSAMTQIQPRWFVQENIFVICRWLKSFFASAGYEDCVIDSTSSDSCINVKINISKNEPAQNLYYPFEDINKAGTKEQCFNALRGDVQNDLMFLDFQKKYPAYFKPPQMPETAYLGPVIRSWDFHEGKVNFRQGLSTDLSSITGGSSEISLELLNNELKRLGLYPKASLTQF